MPSKARREKERARRADTKPAGVQSESGADNKGPQGVNGPSTGDVRPNDGPGTATEQLPTDTDRPSGTNDDTSEGKTPARPTAREGLKPVGTERPHPTAAARPGKTAGQAGQPAPGVNPAAAELAEQRKAGKLIKVEATQMGYYGEERRRTGDVFFVTEDQFSKNWMRPADPDAEVHTTTPQQALNEETGRVRASKRSDAGARRTATSTGDRNPLG